MCFCNRNLGQHAEGPGGQDLTSGGGGIGKFPPEPPQYSTENLTEHFPAEFPRLVTDHCILHQGSLLFPVRKKPETSVQEGCFASAWPRLRGRRRVAVILCRHSSASCSPPNLSMRPEATASRP